jgi:hypothetical protein
VPRRRCDRATYAKAEQPSQIARLVADDDHDAALDRRKTS